MFCLSFLREVAQALLLLGVAAGLVYIAVTAALNYDTIYQVLRNLAQEASLQEVAAHPLRFILLLLLSIITLFLTFNIVNSLLTAWRIRRRHRALGVDWAGLEAKTLQTWVPPSVLVGAAAFRGYRPFVPAARADPDPLDKRTVQPAHAG